MSAEKYLDPPHFIQEWESNDESTWPKPPACLGDDETYFSFNRTVKREETDLFPSEILDRTKDVRDQLKQLNHSILVAYLAIISKQMNQPHRYEVITPYVYHLRLLISTMHQALNSYRPYQAKKYYALLFEKQVEHKEKLYEQLKALIDDANNKYKKNFEIPKKSMEEC
ncbi:MED7, putative [Entamoeba histolytica HM-1:IMSS-B]|uniref:Mediator of RNA polymerase II transcription subunit 7 n=6 Tax=Entamoeba histolytica TaxID=5759 RepID=C4M7J3_ENTH1|nr:hypothetical protein EHI_170300 [Entamoeba histolytica HM-1:IMSS]EMD48983.1 MED7 protein, putative [Entamoeba histolytica KU27]EMH77726.1 MED7, putative [Entamoeba histolytica HM-1:IMSS-B]EMS14546.1 hypothetical protein KM1_026520 [Entamoeba histolytica HM-3:IMSS]ENY64784.1 MED7 protein, putative [Entamoeba histolytica HM-1:IMSS-A]GAT97505.1 hypothetical protein CL6EHI_170300 [Entamoeba histolytica]|eukprot:XP_651043.1 hypothetical protein EHI_170300 [Entamoeba histolytica HM-1:IMSS]